MIPLGVFPLTMAVLLPYLAYALGGSELIAVTQVPSFFIGIGGMIGVALWVGLSDGWLGALTLWVVLWAALTPSTYTYELAFLFVFSVVALHLVRTLSPAQREGARLVLVTAGFLQVLITLSQAMGYRFYWFSPGDRILGLMGNPDYLAAYLAIITPLSPWWLVPVFAAGLLLTKSVIGLIAATLGLWWGSPRSWRCLVPSGALLVAAVLSVKPNWPANVLSRWDVWRLSLTHTTSWQWVVGHGLGSWLSTIPTWQIQDAVWNQGHGFFGKAHNEYVQTLYELGVTGLACVGAWLWTQREMFATPFGGAVIAMLVCASAMFGFHVASVAMLSAIVLGLATNGQQRLRDLTSPEWDLAGLRST